jgi:hypothetical protein
MSTQPLLLDSVGTLATSCLLWFSKRASPDSYKIDGCGAQRDIELWARMFNHSQYTSHRGIMIENCHDGDGAPASSPGANEPYYDSNGALWCPFHTYRTSGDARPTYGSLMHNLNSTRRLAAGNLSLPGCWAYRKKCLPFCIHSYNIFYPSHRKSLSGYDGKKKKCLTICITSRFY